MKIFSEVKEIALCVSKMEAFAKQLSGGGFDTDGINWFTAVLVTLDEEDIQHFKDTNGETEEYFVDQWTGYCEDDYHGELYFKTDIPGQYVRVHFDL